MAGPSVGVGVKVTLFHFSSIRLLCFREKFSKDNYTDHQCKLGQYPRLTNSGLYKGLDSNKSVKKKMELSPM